MSPTCHSLGNRSWQFRLIPGKSDMLHVPLSGEQAITDGRTGRVRARSSRVVILVAFLAMPAGLPQARQRIAGLFWQHPRMRRH